MKLKSISIYLFVFLLLLGCGDSEEDMDNMDPDNPVMDMDDPISETEERSPGHFQLTQLGLEREELAGGRFLQESDFNLGSIKASKEYFFLLSNGGDEPIFDILLSSDNEAFIVSPSNIERLQGASDTTTTQNVVPIISLGIEHGIRLNGIGFSNVLPAGLNGTSLNIIGSTLSSGDTIDVSLSISMSVEAQVLDLKIRIGGEDFDTSNTFQNKVGILPQTGFPPVEHKSVIINTASKSIVIENSGNIPLGITLGIAVFSTTWTNTSFESFSLEAGETLSPSIPNQQYQAMFEINANGTISDQNRLPLDENGNLYILISSP